MPIADFINVTYPKLSLLDVYNGVGLDSASETIYKTFETRYAELQTVELPYMCEEGLECRRQHTVQGRTTIVSNFKTQFDLIKNKIKTSHDKTIREYERVREELKECNKNCCDYAWTEREGLITLRDQKISEIETLQKEIDVLIQERTDLSIVCPDYVINVIGETSESSTTEKSSETIFETTYETSEETSEPAIIGGPGTYPT